MNQLQKLFIPNLYAYTVVLKEAQRILIDMFALIIVLLSGLFHTWSVNFDPKQIQPELFRFVFLQCVATLCCPCINLPRVEARQVRRQRYIHVRDHTVKRSSAVCCQAAQIEADVSFVCLVSHLLLFAPEGSAQNRAPQSDPHSLVVSAIGTCNQNQQEGGGLLLLVRWTLAPLNAGRHPIL